MTDLEIVRRCAVAIGYKLTQTDPDLWRLTHENGDVLNISAGGMTLLRKYDPLHDKAQAMELLFFLISAGVDIQLARDIVIFDRHVTCAIEGSIDLPVLLRAICECVAKIGETA